jgi:arylsulfatase A-like enzyme
MRSPVKELERWFQAILAGGTVGLLTGVLEYAWLVRHRAFVDDLIKGYQDIVLPHMAAGAVGGVIVTAVARLILKHDVTMAERRIRLWAWLVTLLLFAYAVTYVTYWLGRPALKLSNIAVYLALAVGAALLGVVLQRFFGVLPAIRAARASRGWLSAALAALALLAVIPPMLLHPLLAAGDINSAALAPRTGSVSAGATRPNIVLIVIDTLRADHLPIYGYSRETAPVLGDLARRSAIFTRMYAQSASTKPSIATMFSSVYPSVHNVHDTHDFVSDSLTVLAEVLRAAGYRTFGVSANTNVSPTFGYSQGFEEFRVWKTESALRLTSMGRVLEEILGSTRLARLLGERREIVPRAEMITELTLDWVSRNARGPLFLYTHYIDPHFPYRAPAPYGARFDHRRQAPLRAGGVDPLLLLAPGNDRDRVARTLDQYDGEISYADHHVGRLLEGLRKRGVLDDAIVIVTADHGEEFFEHGKDGHGKSAYEEVLRVPFLVHWPARIAPATIEQPAGLIDVMPTLLALLGIETQADMQGISLAPALLQSPDPPAGRRLFAQVVSGSFTLEMVFDGRHKLIRHVRGPREGEEELYDLARDPLERTNVAAQLSAARTALREDLQGFNTFVRQGGRVAAERLKTLDRATERALRSLGYIK